LTFFLGIVYNGYTNPLDLVVEWFGISSPGVGAPGDFFAI